MPVPFPFWLSDERAFCAVDSFQRMASSGTFEAEGN